MADFEVSCAHDSRAIIGESPFWDVRDAALYYTDIAGGKIHRFTPADGAHRTWTLDEMVGCLAIRESGGAVIGTKSGLYGFDFDTGEKTLIAAPEEGRPDSRFNDSTTDPRGRFWAGTMSMNKPAPPDGAFYRLDPDLSCTHWLGGIFTTNGLAFSPDGRTMYFSDSNAAVRTIWVCDYDPDTGAPTNRRVFFDTRQVAGRPDGGTVDADGCYWMAGVGGWQILRITPAGRVDRIIEVPVERPSKPMFGGGSLDVLFFTSISEDITAGTQDRQPQAGSLFAITGLGVQGVPQARFAG